MVSGQEFAQDTTLYQPLCSTRYVPNLRAPSSFTTRSPHPLLILNFLILLRCAFLAGDCDGLQEEACDERGRWEPLHAPLPLQRRRKARPVSPLPHPALTQITSNDAIQTQHNSTSDSYPLPTRKFNVFLQQLQSATWITCFTEKAHTHTHTVCMSMYRWKRTPACVLLLLGAW